MERRHGETKLEGKSIQAPEYHVQTEDQGTPPDHAKGHSGTVLSATKTTRWPSPSFKDKWGSTRWCGKGTQTLEQLLKGFKRWEKENH